jgi:hypothetical protein
MGYESFVGAHDIAIRHGLTIGELARLYAAELDLDAAALDVVRCEGWRRVMRFEDCRLPWVLPSPNMPTADTAVVYPGQCLLEGTNLSEGRGTTRPFEICGAPWIDGDATGFDILMTHQDQVTVLPDGAEVLASAPYCPIGAYRAGDHLFCVQGHPEFVAPLSAYLAEKRRERIGDDVVDAALASLNRPLDHARVVDWIGRFYRLDRN